jgi:hypothetical protein
VHAILGVSATGDAGVAASLAGEWLANVFGRGFTEARTGESSLAVEAFYDALSGPIGDCVLLGAIGLAENSGAPMAHRPATSCLHAGRPRLADTGAPIRLHFQGIARALLSGGRALVMFEHLPGAIELTAESTPPLPPGTDVEGFPAEAIALYGFGTVKRPRSLGGLTSGISHRVVEGT